MRTFRLSFLLTVLLSMVGANVFAHDIEVENEEGVTIYYNFINDGTELEVTYRGNSFTSYTDRYEANVIIPESVIYDDKIYNVTSIGEWAFYHCSGLTSITISNSVTTIDGTAFGYCSGLTELTIPNSVENIGSTAFSDCSSLKELTILDGESELALSIASFHNCPIEQLYLGRNINCNLEGSPFMANILLNSLVIGDGVTSIGNFAFSGCSGLKELTISNSVTSIGTSAFSRCALTDVTIPNSVTSIGNSAFLDCI